MDFVIKKHNKYPFLDYTYIIEYSLIEYSCYINDIDQLIMLTIKELMGSC